MAAMHLRRSKLWGWIRRFPRKKHLKDTTLHRWCGDRIFLPELWRLEERGVSAGVALGLFWAMMPIPFQMIPAGIAAFFAKVNVPAAITSVWITNPVTWPFILYWQYKLGGTILGIGAVPGVGAGTSALLLGCFVSGFVFGAVGWMITRLCWRVAQKLHRPHVKPHRPKDAEK